MCQSWAHGTQPGQKTHSALGKRGVKGRCYLKGVIHLWLHCLTLFMAVCIWLWPNWGLVIKFKQMVQQMGWKRRETAQKLYNRVSEKSVI